MPACLQVCMYVWRDGVQAMYCYIVTIHNIRSSGFVDNSMWVSNPLTSKACKQPKKQIRGSYKNFIITGIPHSCSWCPTEPNDWIPLLGTPRAAADGIRAGIGVVKGRIYSPICR